MSNIKNTLLSAATVCSILAGVSLIAGNGAIVVQAELTGIGTTVLDRPDVPVEIRPGGYHSAAPVQSLLAKAEVQMFLGMLLIILGFLCYTLIHIGNEVNARRVRVHAAPPRSEEATRMQRFARKSPKWFWVEIRV